MRGPRWSVGCAAMAIGCLGTVLTHSSTRAIAWQARADTPRANAVVAADGSGEYRTVQEAINAVPQNTSASNRWIIFIKAGTYRELIYVQREKRFVTLVGEDSAPRGSANLQPPVRVHPAAERRGQRGSARTKQSR